MNDFEPMNPNQLEDAGLLPDALQNQLHRRRRSRQVKISGGVFAMAIAFSAAGLLLFPSTPNPAATRYFHDQATALMINDPIFDQLDSSDTPKIDTNRWRADRFLRDDWTLDM